MGDRPRVELFLRSLAPETARAEQDDLIERLQWLEADGRLRTFEVHVCGACLCPSTAAADTDTGRFLLARFEQFESWAAERDRSLVGVRRRCVESSLAGDTVSGLSLPRMTLAEFVDGEVRFVAPSAGSSTTTVRDRLDVLADE